MAKVGETVTLMCPIVADPKPRITWEHHPTTEPSSRAFDSDRFDVNQKKVVYDSGAVVGYYNHFRCGIFLFIYFLITDKSVDGYRYAVYEQEIRTKEWRFYLNITAYTPADAGHYICMAANAADKIMEVYDVYDSVDAVGM
jgi:hypothetical protein